MLFHWGGRRNVDKSIIQNVVGRIIDVCKKSTNQNNDTLRSIVYDKEKQTSKQLINILLSTLT